MGSNKEAPWGWSAHFDFAAGNINAISNRESLQAFAFDLIEQVKMTRFGPFWCENFASHDPEKEGFSFSQMITTSCLTGHFVTMTGDGYVCLFTCKPFDVETMEACIRKHFKPTAVRYTKLDRYAPEI